MSASQAEAAVQFLLDTLACAPQSAHHPDLRWDGRQPRAAAPIDDSAPLLAVAASDCITGDVVMAHPWVKQVAAVGLEDKNVLLHTYIIALRRASANARLAASVPAAHLAYVRALPDSYTDPEWTTPAARQLLRETYVGKTVDARCGASDAAVELLNGCPCLKDAPVDAKEYRWAKSVCTTRQFLPAIAREWPAVGKDNHGVPGVLLPGIDMLNHAPNAKVTLRVDASSVALCTNVAAGAEPVNNYGPKTNAALYVTYGFVVPGNVHNFYPVVVAGRDGAAQAEIEAGLTAPVDMDLHTTESAAVEARTVRLRTDGDIVNEQAASIAFRSEDDEEIGDRPIAAVHTRRMLYARLTTDREKARRGLEAFLTEHDRDTLGDADDMAVSFVQDLLATLHDLIPASLAITSRFAPGELLRGELDDKWADVVGRLAAFAEYDPDLLETRLVAVVVQEIEKGEHSSWADFLRWAADNLARMPPLPDEMDEDVAEEVEDVWGPLRPARIRAFAQLGAVDVETVRLADAVVAARGVVALSLVVPLARAVTIHPDAPAFGFFAHDEWLQLGDGDSLATLALGHIDYLSTRETLAAHGQCMAETNPVDVDRFMAADGVTLVRPTTGSMRPADQEPYRELLAQIADMRRDLASRCPLDDVKTILLAEAERLTLKRKREKAPSPQRS